MRCVTPCLLPQSPHPLQGVTLALCGAAEGWKAGPLHSAVLSTGTMTSDVRNSCSVLAGTRGKTPSRLRTPINRTHVSGIIQCVSFCDWFISLSFFFKYLSIHPSVHLSV